MVCEPQMTRYEIIIKKPGWPTCRLEYSERIGRAALIRAIKAANLRIQPASLAALYDVPEAAIYTWPGSGLRAALTSSCGLWVGFSGRTEREAKQEGEQPEVSLRNFGESVFRPLTQGIEATTIYPSAADISTHQPEGA